MLSLLPPKGLKTEHWSPWTKFLTLPTQNECLYEHVSRLLPPCLTGDSVWSWWNSRTINAQGCVLSPLLLFMDTNSYTSCHQSVKLFEFVDDTTHIGLIMSLPTDGRLETWCRQNNLELNTPKAVEMVVDSCSVVFCTKSSLITQIILSHFLLWWCYICH